MLYFYTRNIDDKANCIQGQQNCIRTMLALGKIAEKTTAKQQIINLAIMMSYRFTYISL